MTPVAIRSFRLLFWAVSVLFIACSASASPNPAWFTRIWRTDDGLPDNNVEGVVQGRDNYLWVVTSVGLARFDGISFNRFPIEDFVPSLDSRIHLITCGRNGVLWMVSDGGTVIGLNPDFSTVPCPQTGLPAHVPQAIVEDQDGSLWLGYFGSPWTGYSSVIYHVKNGQVTQFGAGQGVPAGNFHSLISDSTGNIWLAKGREIDVLQNGQFHYVLSTYVAQCLAASLTNTVWFVADGHLFDCNIEGTMHDYGAYQRAGDPDTTALLQDHTGAVWIGTDGNGLFRYNGTSFEKIETSHSTILSLAEDHEGNLWVGTAGGGLDRVSLSGVQLEAFENNQVQIQSICQDTNGVLWGATQNGGLISRVNGQWKQVFTNAIFAGSNRCVAATSDGVVWTAQRDGQIVRVANTNYEVLHLINTVRSSIFGLLPASSGDLWVVRRDTLQRLHNGQLNEARPPQQVQRISAITEDAAGNIWIGARGAVMRYDGTNFVDETPYLPVANRSIYCLYGTSDGSVWISCSGLGLLRFKDGRVGQVGVGQGLFDGDISQMLADGHGWFWFGSDHGIFKLRQRELEQSMANQNIRLRPIVYGKNEGLASVEALSSTEPPYVLPMAVLDNDGLVWLLMHTGVIAADPQILPGNSDAPPTLLTRVAMDGQDIASYDGFGAQNSANLKTLAVPLQLPPSYRHLEFDFTAFHFSAPENIRFRYQLVGFDNDWIDIGTSRNATYSRLTSGKYKFHVEACIGDGPWSASPVTLAFDVAPFFWETWWFRIGVLVLFTSSVIAIVRYISFHRLQKEMRLIEQRAALDKERARIARDLHDDLGGSLNSVALSLDMVQRLKPPDVLNGKIQRCSTMVRKVARSVDEIVWAINPRNDTLRYVVDYISQSAVEFLHDANIPCRVDLPDKIPDRMVSPEARHNLLLIVKEALNNVVRHARASEVRLRITASDSEVSFSVEDNGCGFEGVPDNASSEGLRNMRQRIEEIGGQFQLDSRPGKGTRVAVFYSWPGTNGK